MNELRNNDVASFIAKNGKELVVLLGFAGFLGLCKYAIDNGYGFNIKAAYKDFTAEATFNK